MNLYKDRTKILMLTHYTDRSEKGEDTDLRILNYLKDKVKKVMLITHPFPEFGHRESICLMYENGQRKEETRISIIQGPFLMQYLHHLLIIYYLLFKRGLNYDLCIALENLSFISVFPLRLLGFLKRLVYYSVDFIPQRFQNPFLNYLYHLMDKFACRYSDTNWVMVKEQIQERTRYQITPANSAPFTLVPIGYDIQNINVLDVGKIDIYNIVYMGAIRKSMGPQLAIQSLPTLIKKIPQIRLTIIGSGKYLNNLYKLVTELKIKRYVNFTGYVNSFQKLTQMLAKKSLGLAPYVPAAESFSYYSDPSKIKLYMCCGLPVITTSVATMSNLISKTKSGIVIDYSEQALCNNIIYLLSDEDRYKLYRDAAIRVSKKFDINHILETALRKIPS